MSLPGLYLREITLSLLLIVTDVVTSLHPFFLWVTLKALRSFSLVPPEQRLYWQERRFVNTQQELFELSTTNVGT